jgi:hypothetical protein
MPENVSLDRKVGGLGHGDEGSNAREKARGNRDEHKSLYRTNVLLQTILNTFDN